MQYDPIKEIIFKTIKKNPWLRKLFFFSLDLILLRQWYIKRQIKQLFRFSDELLMYDAGAGFCQYSDYVLNKWEKSHVIALDLKEEYLKEYSIYAQNKYPGRFNTIYADLVDFVPNKKFDLIIAIDILEHIENDIKVLTNFHSCLKNKGKLIISTPSDQDEAAKFTSEHVRPGYHVEELRNKLNTAGFKIRTLELSYGNWGKYSWILGIKTPMKLTKYSNLMLILLPIYYIFLYPIIFLLMMMDLKVKNCKGNGIIVVAEKSVNAS